MMNTSVCSVRTWTKGVYFCDIHTFNLYHVLSALGVPVLTILDPDLLQPSWNKQNVL